MQHNLCLHGDNHKALLCMSRTIVTCLIAVMVSYLEPFWLGSEPSCHEFWHTCQGDIAAQCSASQECQTDNIKPFSCILTITVR